MSQINEDIKRLVAQEVQRLQKESIPHTCSYCDYFQLSKTPPTNRYCQYIGMLQVDKGRCQTFTPAPDYQERRAGNITV